MSRDSDYSNNRINHFNHPERNSSRKNSPFAWASSKGAYPKGDWLSKFTNNREEIKLDHLSKANRLKRSVVRNLLDSSNQFYIEENERAQREHSRELLKQIHENKERKNKERRRRIDYERKLDAKIRKGWVN